MNGPAGRQPAKDPAQANDPMPPVELTLDIGPIAHGGHCVARHEGRVIFVRHGIPGERARVRLTDAEPGAAYWRADVVDVLQASADRIAHPWPEADALDAAGKSALPVGGAEFGHMALPAQRALKAAVLSEQLQRLAGVQLAVDVEAADGDELTGFGWRTRVSFAVVPETGQLGMHAHRSGTIVPISRMPLATAAIDGLGLPLLDFRSIERVEVAAPANGSAPLILLIPEPDAGKRALQRVLNQLPAAVSVALWRPAEDGGGDGAGTLERLRGRTWVAESAAGFEYRVTGDGFWQIHRQAPQVLTEAVLTGLQLGPGEKVADLYAGAGLFSAPLAAAVGETGAVLSVEGAPGTSRDARRNLHAYPQVEVVHGRVEKVLRAQQHRFDAVVLDPARAGAGKAVVQELVRANPRAIGYVSCDPASFARDLNYFLQAGWQLESLRAFDLYPNTHHLETFGVLVPGG